MKSYFLQVKDIIKETEDTITIEFWHPLSEQIKYKAGQFLTIIVPADGGKKVRRSYSMSTSPHTDTAVGVTIKRVHQGLVSNYLNDNVKKGDFLEVLEPMGTFHYDSEPEKDRNIYLIGAGSGITPLISIAKSALKSESHAKVRLIYGNRSENSIIFKNALHELEKAYGDRFEVRHILSNPSAYWVGDKGRINQANATMFLKNWGVNFNKDEFFMCGPEQMMEEIKKIYTVYEVPKERAHFEKFNAPMLNETMEEKDDNSLKPQTVKVIYDGEEHVFLVEPHQSILEAALEKDIDLPYSCQAGMCTACLGLCKEGKVKMDEEDGLTEKEIAKGYVLTCVSHPLTEGVVIEID
jgi:ring-1,2-phenylacetyl-CoA epoxidase subunit PaaE